MYYVCISMNDMYLSVLLYVLYVLHVLRIPAAVTAPGRRRRGAPGPAPRARAPGGSLPRHHPSPSCEDYRFGPIQSQSL